MRVSQHADPSHILLSYITVLRDLLRSHLLAIIPIRLARKLMAATRPPASLRPRRSPGRRGAGVSTAADILSSDGWYPYRSRNRKASAGKPGRSSIVSSWWPIVSVLALQMRTLVYSPAVCRIDVSDVRLDDFAAVRAIDICRLGSKSGTRRDHTRTSLMDGLRFLFWGLILHLRFMLHEVHLRHLWLIYWWRTVYIRSMCMTIWCGVGELRHGEGL